jgi:hypothetical protein
VPSDKFIEAAEELAAEHHDATKDAKLENSRRGGKNSGKKAKSAADAIKAATEGVQAIDAVDEAEVLADGDLDFRDAARFTGAGKLPTHTKLGLHMVNIKGTTTTPKVENVMEWTEKAARRLLPEALATIASSLRSDNEQRRLDAAEKILRVNGVDKRASVDGGNATLIVNLGQTASAFEWLKKPAPTVTGSVVRKGDDEGK